MLGAYTDIEACQGSQANKKLKSSTPAPEVSTLVADRTHALQYRHFYIRICAELFVLEDEIGEVFGGSFANVRLFVRQSLT